MNKKHDDDEKQKPPTGPQGGDAETQDGGESDEGDLDGTIRPDRPNDPPPPGGN